MTNGDDRKKRYLIATACNRKYENFLLNHWFRSLKDNVNLSDTDVLVMDFGLSEYVQRELSQNGVMVKKAIRTDGHINNMRFFELGDFLKEKPHYEQVILCDSGDLIFQSDISDIFNLEPDKVKAVVEDVSFNFELLVDDDIVENADEIKKFLSGKQLVNMGFVVYPRDVFLNLVEKMGKILKDPRKWGTDQAIINYFLLKMDFYKLEAKYNFNPTTTICKYIVDNGKFYLLEGRKKVLIPVVHNAGGVKIWRPILNFGYGLGYNKPRKIWIFVNRSFFRITSALSRFFRRI